MADSGDGKEREQSKDPPWAWVCLIGMTYTQLLLNGVARSVGVLYVEFLTLFNQGPFMTGWVTSTYSICHSIWAPLFGYVADRYSGTARWCVMAAGLLGAAGLLVAGFAPNLPTMIFGYGVLTGTANSIAFSCTVAMMNRYFTKKRSLANGISFAGSGLGAVSLPFLYYYLSDELTVRGALIVTAGFWLNLCAAGALLRPLPPYTSLNDNADVPSQVSKRKTTSSSRSRQSFHINDGYFTDVTADGHCASASNPFVIGLSYQPTQPVSVFSVENNSKCITKTHEGNDQSRTVPPINDNPKNGSEISQVLSRSGNVGCTQTQDPTKEDPLSPIVSSASSCRADNTKDNRGMIQTFCSSAFIVYSIFLFSGLFGFYGVTQFIPAYSQDLNLSKTNASTLLSIVGGTDLVARLVLGALGDFPWINKKLFVICNFTIAGTATIILPYIHSWYLLIGYAALLGTFGGSFLVYMGPLVVDAIGVKYVGTGIGFSSMLFGIATTVAPITFGSVKEWTGTYTYAITAAGCFFLFGALVFACGNWYSCAAYVKNICKKIHTS